MKKNKTKLLVILGAICILLVAVSSWYTITFNEARFIVPMDISTYTFRLKDLPMIISGILITFYVLYLVVLLIQVIAVNKRKGNNATITRNLNPKLGFLGFLGCFGFLGFWTYNIDKTIFPFVFLCILVSLVSSMKENCQILLWTSDTKKTKCTLIP